MALNLSTICAPSPHLRYSLRHAHVDHLRCATIADGARCADERPHSRLPWPAVLLVIGKLYREGVAGLSASMGVVRSDPGRLSRVVGPESPALRSCQRTLILLFGAKRT
jgi:hypothetical protein